MRSEAAVPLFGIGPVQIIFTDGTSPWGGGEGANLLGGEEIRAGTRGKSATTPDFFAAGRLRGGAALSLQGTENGVEDVVEALADILGQEAQDEVAVFL